LTRFTQSVRLSAANWTLAEFLSAELSSICNRTITQVIIFSRGRGSQGLPFAFKLKIKVFFSTS